MGGILSFIVTASVVRCDQREDRPRKCTMVALFTGCVKAWFPGYLMRESA